jgi:hypothetical protein
VGVRGYPKSGLAPNCLNYVVCTPLLPQTKEPAHGNASTQSLSDQPDRRAIGRRAAAPPRDASGGQCPPYGYFGPPFDRRRPAKSAQTFVQLPTVQSTASHTGSWHFKSQDGKMAFMAFAIDVKRARC